jgi:hypothetical protein
MASIPPVPPGNAGIGGLRSDPAPTVEAVDYAPPVNPIISQVYDELNALKRRAPHCVWNVIERLAGKPILQGGCAECEFMWVRREH